MILPRVIVRVVPVAALMLSAAAHAEPTDTAVKAAFLPRFARYVTWPPGAAPKGSAPFVLCVIGRDPFGSQLDNPVRSQTVEGRRIVVRRIDSSSAAAGCHLAFQSAASRASVPAMPVLTVTDAAHGGERGIINFVVTAGRVRFYIDQRAAEQRGLSISSRLLALAVGVRQ